MRKYLYMYAQMFLCKVQNIQSPSLLSCVFIPCLCCIQHDNDRRPSSLAFLIQQPQNPVHMHLVEYKLFHPDVKILYPLYITIDPIQNFVILLVSISSRNQKPLDQARLFLQLSQFRSNYFNEKYGLVKNTYFLKKRNNSIFKVGTPQALTKSIKTNKTNASCYVYFICLNFKINAPAFK